MAAARKKGQEAMGRMERESGLGTQGRRSENLSAKTTTGSVTTGPPNKKKDVNHNGSDKKTPSHTAFRPSRTRSLHPKTPNKITCASAPAFTTRLPANQARMAQRSPPSKPKRAAVSAGSGLIKEKIQATQIPQQPWHPGQSAHALIPVRIKKASLLNTFVDFPLDRRLKLVDPERNKTFSPPAPRCPLSGNRRLGLNPHGTPSKHSAVTGGRSAPSVPSAKQPLPVADLYKRREAAGDARGKSVSSSPYQKKGPGSHLLTQRMNDLVLTHKKCKSGTEGANHKDLNKLSSIHPQNTEQGNVNICDNTAQVHSNPCKGLPEANLGSSKLSQDCSFQEPHVANGCFLVEIQEATVSSCKEPPEATNDSLNELQEAHCHSVKEPQVINGGSSDEPKEANTQPFKESKGCSDPFFEQPEEVRGPSFKDPKEADVCFFEEAQENEHGKTPRPTANHQSISTDKEVTDGQRNSDGLKMSSVSSHMFAESSQAHLPRVDNKHVKDKTPHGSPHQILKSQTMEPTTITMLQSAEESGLKEENHNMPSTVGAKVFICLSPRDNVYSAQVDLQKAFLPANNNADLPKSDYRDSVPNRDLANIQDHTESVQDLKVIKGETCHEDFATGSTSKPPNSWSDQSELVRKSQGILFLTKSTDENAIFIPKLRFEFTPDNSIDWTSLPQTGFNGEGQVKGDNVRGMKPCTPRGPSFSKSALKRSIALPNHCHSELDQLQKVPFPPRSGGTIYEHSNGKSQPYPLHEIVDLSLSFEDKFSEQALPEDIPKILLSAMDEDEDNE